MNAIGDIAFAIHFVHSRPPVASLNGGNQMKPDVELPTNPTHDLPVSGFVRLKQLIGPGNPLPVSKSTIWKWVAASYFPQPVKLSSKVSAWKVEDVRAFFAARADEVR